MTALHSRPRRLNRPWLTAGFVLAVVAALIGSFLLGGALTTPTEKALNSAPERIQAFASAERRAVTAHAPFTGKITRGIEQPLLTEPPSGVSATVTHMAVAEGRTLHAFDYLGELAGVPLFAVSSRVPLYRDLRLGDRGRDVLAFQRELASSGFSGVRATGVVDEVTLEAVQLIHTNQLVPPPARTRKETVIRLASFVKADLRSATVIRTAAVASTVGEKNPFLTVSSGGLAVSGFATLPLADSLSPGASVKLAAGTVTGTGRVAEVGPFAKNEEQVLGRAVTVHPDPSFASLPDNRTVTVELTSAAPPGLAVPLIALRQHEGGYAVLAAKDRDSEPSLVRLNVTSQAEGWAAVSVLEGELSEGHTLWIP